jgi:hypothetical protein
VKRLRWLGTLVISAAFAACFAAPVPIAPTTATPTVAVTAGAAVLATATTAACLDVAPSTAQASAPTSDSADDARTLMTAWLTYYTGSPACRRAALRDFRIEIGDLRYRSGIHWIVPVGYSVLPADGADPTSWHAGNGVVAGDWIERKSVFLTFRREGNTLILEQMTTSPPKLPIEPR